MRLVSDVTELLSLKLLIFCSKGHLKITWSLSLFAYLFSVVKFLKNHCITAIAVGLSFPVRAFWQGQKKKERWNLKNELHFSNLIGGDGRFTPSVEKNDAVVVQQPSLLSLHFKIWHVLLTSGTSGWAGASVAVMWPCTSWYKTYACIGTAILSAGEKWTSHFQP